jgi:hypothetical protein
VIPSAESVPFSTELGQQATRAAESAKEWRSAWSTVVVDGAKCEADLVMALASDPVPAPDSSKTRRVYVAIEAGPSSVDLDSPQFAHFFLTEQESGKAEFIVEDAVDHLLIDLVPYSKTLGSADAVPYFNL